MSPPPIQTPGLRGVWKLVGKARTTGSLLRPTSWEHDAEGEFEGRKMFATIALSEHELRAGLGNPMRLVDSFNAAMIAADKDAFGS